MTRLNDAKLRKLKANEKIQKLSDGGGLSFVLKPNGGRYWHQNYRFAGKQRTISFGTYPEVSIKEARRRREEAREQLAQGLDPSAIRMKLKEDKKREASETVGRTLWREVAADFLDLEERKGKAPKTMAKMRSQLKHTYAKLGDQKIDAIKAPDLLSMLREIEQTGKLTTATRLRGLCGQVFRFAMASGLVDHDPTPALRGALLTPPTRHYPGLTNPDGVGRLMRSIKSLHDGEPTTRWGLLLLAYTFQRPGEVRNLRWADVDWAGARIDIPSERMKMKRPHAIPLSTQALKVLKEAHDHTGGGELILPGYRSTKRPISDATLSAALARLGYSKDAHVPHGFRTTASTLLNEAGWNRDWIERQLAHVEKNAIRRAYNRAEFFDGRTQMMQAYADMLDQLSEQITVATAPHEQEGDLHGI